MSMAAFAIAWHHATEDRWETDPSYGSTAMAVLERPVTHWGVPMFIRQSGGWIARVWFDARRREVMMEVV